MVNTKKLSFDDIEVLHSKEDVDATVTTLARQISARFRGQSVCMLCIMNGATHFFCDLTSQIREDVEVYEMYLRVSSYGGGTTSSGKVSINMNDLCPDDIKGKPVVIVEDIVDSGLTMQALLAEIKKMSPESISVCTLINKTSRRKVEDIKIDFCGFEIHEDYFIVGYGLDIDKRFRNLKFIGYIPERLL